MTGSARRERLLDPFMTHRRAVLAMIAAALMWSIAGVVTRHLEAARSFEITVWRRSLIHICRCRREI